MHSTRMKRRRIGSNELRDPKAGENTPSAMTAEQKELRQARVASLLDQVQQNMSKPARPQAMPSSPSPLVSRYSPREQQTDIPSSPPLPPQRPKDWGGDQSGPKVQHLQGPDPESDLESDYGVDDEDIDMEFMEKVEEIERITSTARQQSQVQKEPPPLPAQPPPRHPPPTPAVFQDDEFNEFDDDDDLFSSVEFQQLAAQFDAPAKVGTGPPWKSSTGDRR